MKVTVSLDEPARGQSVATKTMVASDLDEAAAAAAGYVAQHIFTRDPTTPPWCVGAANGSDLAAWLLAKQERRHVTPDDIRRARGEQIRILERATGNSQCAGIVRYELAQLYDLEGNHMAALRLHAVNREQHPRFYRGRYRLSMSLEMIANPAFRLRETMRLRIRTCLVESLAILNRCDVTRNNTRWEDHIVDGELQPKLRETLLVAAREELRAIRRQLTLRHVIWGTFRHRDERVIRGPHWGLRKRQSFHDGLCAAELLVAIRRILNGKEPPQRQRETRSYETGFAQSGRYCPRQCPDQSAFGKQEGARPAGTARHVGAPGPEMATGRKEGQDPLAALAAPHAVLGSRV